jgi:serine/threonine protein kinase
LSKNPSIKLIATIANSLDASGHTDLASRLDNLLYKAALDEWQHPNYSDVDLDEEEEAIQNPPSEEEEFEGNVRNELGLGDDDSRAPNTSVLEDVMLDNGVIPLRGASGSKLGKGFQGTVLRGLWNGKQVAIKLIGKFGSKEIANLNKLEEIRDSLDPEVQKHLPIIYEVGHDEVNQFHYIIMEMLKPLSPTMRHHLYDYTEKSKPITNINSILKDEGILYRSVVSAFKPYGASANIIHDVFKEILKIKMPPEFTELGSWQDALVELRTKIQEATVKAIMDGKHTDYKYVNGSASDTYEYLKQVFKPEVPASAEEFKDYPKDFRGIPDVPELKSLVGALDGLRKRGLFWSDLHHDNLMMRPGTDDLVFIDFGFFSIGRAEI